MSRTNPSKKKRRYAKTTLLIFGEGMGEEMFLKHLKGLYAYNSNVLITVKKGKGGSADSIVIEASNKPGAYDRKVVVLDNDKSKKEMLKAEKEAKKRNVELIINTTCIESVLLATLNPSNTYNNKSSKFCKKEFETTYIDKKKRSDPTEYTKLFPKTLLDTRRLTLPELSILVSLMESIE